MSTGLLAFTDRGFQLAQELAAALGIDRQEVCAYIQRDYPAWPEE